jgi:arylsulfatase A-like enzyme
MNFLIIQSDQHRYDCIGANGHEMIKTPRLDALAASGTNFSGAYCPSPICTPARATFLSGCWPWKHQCIANWDAEATWRYRRDLPRWSDLLQKAGYGLDYVGKWHVDPNFDPTFYGFDRFVSEDDYDAWRASQGIRPRPWTNRWFGEVDPYATPATTRLGWEADLAIGFLRDRAASGKPFVVRWDPSEPHLANIVPEPYASMYPPADIPPWPGFYDTFENKPYIQRQQLYTWKLQDWTWNDWSHVVSRYLGEISLLDHHVGRVLDELTPLGLDDSTTVIYTSDHGDLCGSHRMIDKHFVMYDDITRVPLIVRTPRSIDNAGSIKRGTRFEGFVSPAVDLPATLLDLAGISKPASFQGRSLLSSEPAPDDVLSCYFGNQFGLFSQRMLRTHDWKFVWNLTCEDELYDLKNDPGELKNLAFVPEHRTTLREMKHRLVRKMKSLGDPIVNQWTEPMLLEDLTAPLR